MNLLLLASDELEGDEVVLVGRRAKHLQKVLCVQPKTPLRAAIIGKGAVETQVKALDAESVTLSCGAVTDSPRPSLDVVLAVPRPKGLSRIIQTVTSFGARSITLVNTWKVDKSYLASPRLELERLREDALIGCEQGRQCHLPDFKILSRFTELLQHHDTPEARARQRYVLHPGNSDLLHRSLNAPQAVGPFTLFFGPDGGFIQRELDSLAQTGWTQVALDTGPLRTEVAVAAALGILSTAPAHRSTHLPPSQTPSPTWVRSHR